MLYCLHIQSSGEEEVPTLKEDRKRKKTSPKNEKKEDIEAKAESIPSKVLIFHWNSESAGFNVHVVVTLQKRKVTATKTKGGTEVEEVEEGNGRVAKAGKRVGDIKNE